MEQTRTKIEERLRDELPGVSVLKVRRMSGGACQENFEVELDHEGSRERLVMRSDAVRSLPSSIDRAQEYAVIGAARAHGVRTPRARFLTTGLRRPEASSYFLDWVDGEAIGRRVVKRPELESARRTLPVTLAKELSKIHAVDPKEHPDLLQTGYNPDPTRDAADAAMSSLESMLGKLKEPHPPMDFALRWLGSRAPRASTVLVHGDFRTGNFMVSETGLAGVLDWEFAHWGAPEEDLSWICVRDWRFSRLDRPVGGFGQRAEFYHAYREASGREIDPEAIHWWEVFNNVSWGLGSIYQAERYLSGEESDIELVAIGRRAAEMEWEALRLIRRGPRWAGTLDRGRNSKGDH
ncbi:MAG: phosphotransferase family protein [Myxococcota bacterium]